MELLFGEQFREWAQPERVNGTWDWGEIFDGISNMKTGFRGVLEVVLGCWDAG